MSFEKVLEVQPANGNAAAADEISGSEPTPQPSTALPPAKPAEVQPQGAEAPETPAPKPWHAFLVNAKPTEIRERFAEEVHGILVEEGIAERYCCLALLEPEDSINAMDLDAVYDALSRDNANHDKDVLLFLLARGGSIEPAYQISKICKTFAQTQFVGTVPRQAKSAATLIALGADEIHMGPLGQLGPIDPQLGGLPALGVSQALETIASVAEKHPGSAEMLARYLQKALTVEQIGYCDRISESAEQYAVRLLSSKPKLARASAQIAKELVHEYKDHGFVIDLDEARKHLGAEWIKTDTAELRAAERVYSLFESVNLFLGISQSRRLFVMGSATQTAAVRIVRKD